MDKIIFHLNSVYKNYFFQIYNNLNSNLPWLQIYVWWLHVITHYILFSLCIFPWNRPFHIKITNSLKIYIRNMCCDSFHFYIIHFEPTLQYPNICMWAQNFCTVFWAEVEVKEFLKFLPYSNHSKNYLYHYFRYIPFQVRNVLDWMIRKIVAIFTFMLMFRFEYLGKQQIHKVRNEINSIYICKNVLPTIYLSYLLSIYLSSFYVLTYLPIEGET